MKNIFKLLFLSASLLWGAEEVAYVKLNSILTSLNDGNTPLGRLIVGSKVKKMGINEEMVEVEFSGFQPEGSPIVYEELGVLMVGYEGVDSSSVEIIEEQKDEYDNVWLHVKVKGYIPKDALIEDKDLIIHEGQDLFMDRCGSCHALHSEDEFDANVWPSIIGGMADLAGLNKDEQDLIVKYLQNSQ